MGAPHEHTAFGRFVRKLLAAAIPCTVQRVSIANRFVIKRLLTPWESRHPLAVANMRFTAGGFQLGLGLVLLSLGLRAGTDRERRKCYRWAAWFLVIAALQFVGGSLDMIALSAPPRP